MMLTKYLPRHLDECRRMCVLGWLNPRSLALFGVGMIASSAHAAAPSAWVLVTNGSHHGIARIDTATYAVSTPVDFGTANDNVVGLAGLPDGSKLYVQHSLVGNGFVSVVSTATVSVIKTIPLALGAGLAASPDGSRVYVAAVPGATTDYSLYAIDTATDTLVGAPIPLPGSHSATGVVVHPDGSRVYVIDSNLGRVFEVRIADGSIRTILLPLPYTFAVCFAVSPDGSSLYVASGTGGPVGLVVIDTASAAVVGTIALRFSSSPDGVAVSPDGRRAYVTLYDTFSSPNGVAVIDTATNHQVGEIAVGSSPDTIEVSPDGTRMFVLVQGSNDVAVVSTLTNSVETRIPLGGAPTNRYGDFIVGSCTGACGDGCLRGGVEQCDDGNVTSGDCCSATCQREAGCCGNGHLDPGEQCDDGNAIAGDGCGATCQIESGCGNGIVEAGEQCDDGNTINGDCCSSACLLEPGCCGNGTRDVGETCDDGNTWSGDCCSSTCQLETGSCFTGNLCQTGTCDGSGQCLASIVPNCCGNHVTEPGEQCDDGNLDNMDSCKFDCTPNVCGDGFVRTGVEQCDAGSGNLPGSGCEPDCTLTPRAVSSVVGAFVGFSTDPQGLGATPAQPVQATVVSPLPGTVSIAVTGNAPSLPTGYAFVGTRVDIVAPPTGNPNTPLDFTFALDAGVVPSGQNENTVQVFRNGVALADCTAGELGGAAPDPCIARRSALPGGDLQFRVFTTAASAWSMGIESCGDGIKSPHEECDDGSGNGSDQCCSATCTRVDADLDGVCDRDDPCTAFGLISAPKIGMKGLATPAADDALSFAGVAHLSYPFVPTLDPRTHGFRLTLDDRDGATIFAVTIPGGAYDPIAKIGWSAAPIGGAWSYKNKAVQPLGGIVAAKFLDLSKKTPGQVKFVIKGKGGAYGFDTAKLPIRAELSMDPPSTTDQCNTARFDAPSGTCSVARGTLKCAAR